MKKIVSEELYVFVNHQTSRSILSSFHHYFDMFINYQQQVIVFFGKNSDLVQNQN